MRVESSSFKVKSQKLKEKGKSFNTEGAENGAQRTQRRKTKLNAETRTAQSQRRVSAESGFRITDEAVPQFS